MRFIKEILLVFFFCFLSSCIYAAVSPLQFKENQIQKILNDWRARSGIPSASLSILPAYGAPITFQSGNTMCTGGQRIQADTLFQAGSITKSFTSMIVLQLEAQGRLNINDPITRYLPQYSRWSNVTIRQLLNHTSGIFNYTETGTFNRIRKSNPEAQFTPMELVNMASDHRDYFRAGHGWKYSNTNYVLAGMIIERVTGQPMANVMQHYLHNSTLLNLNNTYYFSQSYPQVILSRMAHGYSMNGQDVTFDNMSWACAAGAIVSTTQDLLFWWRSLFQNQILPYKQMSEMKTLVCERASTNCFAGQYRSHLSNGDVGKGYGLGIIQSSYGSSDVGSVWWHNGSTKGYKAIVMWYPNLNLYMSLTIDKDPGYLLTPDVAIIRNVINTLVIRKQTRHFMFAMKKHPKKLKSHTHKHPQKKQNVAHHLKHPVVHHKNPITAHHLHHRHQHHHDANKKVFNA